MQISSKDHHTMTITCNKDSTWSGLPKEPRTCEAICEWDLLIRQVPAIDPKYNKYLKNPNDKPYFDCTDGDKYGSVCTLICPEGFEQWTDNKYGVNKATTCERKYGESWWNPRVWKITACHPIGYDHGKNGR